MIMKLATRSTLLAVALFAMQIPLTSAYSADSAPRYEDQPIGWASVDGGTSGTVTLEVFHLPDRTLFCDASIALSKD